MLSAHTRFIEGINSALALSALYDYATVQIRAPMSFDDILRAQLVYSVSAFDKLLHDLVRLGMMQTFAGLRAPTPKYLAEEITMESYGQIATATIPPAVHFFEQAIIRRHAVLSFQDPTKVADALSLIWNEQHKWQVLAGVLGSDQGTVKKTLSAICGRRNKIVHEADFDPIAGTKYTLTKGESEDAVRFLERCGTAIYNQVR